MFFGAGADTPHTVLGVVTNLIKNYSSPVQLTGPGGKERTCRLYLIFSGFPFSCRPREKVLQFLKIINVPGSEEVPCVYRNLSDMIDSGPELKRDLIGGRPNADPS